MEVQKEELAEQQEPGTTICFLGL